MKYEEALDFIYKRQLFGMKLDLENISLLCERLGNPQLAYKTIHIAGTNGKGSVCSLLYSVLRQSGLKVGLYTSPHLVDFRERIQVDGRLISKQFVSALISKFQPMIDKETYFEIVTAMAFEYFRQQKVDVAVIEVGLGGRLDATNIVRPDLCIITDISIDHTAHLGESVEKIASEKAGIIKQGIPVVTIADNAGLGVISKVSQEKGCEVHLASPSDKRSKLFGTFQYRNIGLAVSALKLLKNIGYPVKDIDAGLLSAVWPGRMDFVEKNLLFDCAHNYAGAMILARELALLRRPVVLVLGIMHDKDIRGMCSLLEPLAEKIVLTKPSINRAEAPTDIAKYFTKQVSIVEDVGDAIEYAKLLARNSLVVVTGSIFTVGEAFEKLGIDPFHRSRS